MSRLASAVVTNVTFLLLLAVGIAVRAVTLIAYRPALLLQRDTINYLSTATASDPSPDKYRPALYPVLFLRPLLVFDELVLVVIVQHAIGLGIAVALYLLLRRKGVHAVAAGLVMAPLLLDGYEVNIEHFVLTETFFNALLVAGFLLLAWWKARPPLIACACAGVLLGAAGLTRFVGLALILPAVAYLLWRRVGWLRPSLLALGFAVPVVGYSMWFQSSAGANGVTAKSGFFLYGRVSSFSECEGLELPERLRRYCFKAPPEERPRIPGFWRLDQLKGGVMGDPETNRELLTFARRVILSQPFDYAQAVSKDFLRNFAPGPPSSKEHAEKWRFPRKLSDAEAHPFIVELGGSAPQAMGFDDFEIRRPFADHLRSYQDIVYTHGPLLALLLLLGVFGSIMGLRRSCGANLRADCILFTGGALLILLVPVMVTVYHFRYSLPALPLAGTAAGLGVACLLGRRHLREEGEEQETVAEEELPYEGASRHTLVAGLPLLGS